MIDKPIIINLKKYGFSGEMIVKKTINKNSYLKLDRNNNIVFSQSIYMLQIDNDRFIRNNIVKFLDKQRITYENVPYNLQEGWVILFGNYHKLKYGGTGRRFSINGKQITVYGKNFENAFKNFCKNQENKIIEIAKGITKEIGIKAIIKVKLLKAVWGNCTPLKNIISLNKRLIFFREEVIEYVIYHEITHYTYQNHQKDFWNLVGKFCPNYKKLKKELKTW